MSVEVPIEAIQEVDPAVSLRLPKGTSVKAITPHGSSFWTRTARVYTECNGAPKAYFLKTSFGDRGKAMLSGECTSMNAIHAAVPDLVPRPVAWGTYINIPEVHFFLCDFIEMSDELLDPEPFAAKIAELHRKGTSPNGKFGFPVTTYRGQIPINHRWSNTWEECFTRMTRELLDLEIEVQGRNEEIRQLTGPFFEKVIPRLLRPMETGDRSLKPCLIHGDLWHGNASMNSQTGLPIIFDAASFYAHNEYELGVWRADWNEIGKPHMARYYEHFPPSPPEDEHEDRNLLYATQVNILDSALYNENSEFREKFIVGMRDLVHRYGQP